MTSLPTATGSLPSIMAMMSYGPVTRWAEWTPESLAIFPHAARAFRVPHYVLGDSAFVEAMRQVVAAHAPGAAARIALETLLARVCQAVGLTPAQLAGGGRTPAAVVARAGIAYCWVEGLGRPGRPLAPRLGVQPAAVPKAARRGAATAARWRRLLQEFQKSSDATPLHSTGLLGQRCFDLAHEQWQVGGREAQPGSGNAVMLDIRRDVFVMRIGTGERGIVRMRL